MDNYPHKLMLRPLLAKLTPYFPDYTPTAVKNLVILTRAVLLARTTCLNRAKAYVGTITGRRHTRADSHYKRLIRTVDRYAATDLWIAVVTAGARLLRLESTHLILDGTSWKGPDGAYVHLLTLCVSYGGVAIPIAWTDIAKKGTSSLAERRALFELARQHYDLAGRVLLADREYIGREWFKYLASIDLDFCIRSRDFAYFRTVERGGGLDGERLRAAIAGVKASAKRNRARAIPFRFSAGGPERYLVIARNPDPKARERVMLLITSVEEDAYATVATYLKRWEIEHCFKQLESDGFDLESISLRTRARQRLLIAVTVLAYVLSVLEGLRTYRKAVPVKRHGSRGRVYRAVSVFRYGIDAFGAHLLDLRTFCRYLARAFRKATKGHRSSTLSLNV